MPTSELHELLRARGDRAFPVWSPDGKQIALGIHATGTWVLNADGTNLHRLGYHAYSVAGEVQSWLRPSWRPRPTRQG